VRRIFHQIDGLMERSPDQGEGGLLLVGVKTVEQFGINMMYHLL
jgi:hypothetical protein